MNNFIKVVTSLGILFSVNSMAGPQCKTVVETNLLHIYQGTASCSAFGLDGQSHHLSQYYPETTSSLVTLTGFLGGGFVSCSSTLPHVRTAEVMTTKEVCQTLVTGKGFGTTEAEARMSTQGQGFQVSRCYNPPVGAPWACDGYKHVW
jgi:hypothetical protein